MANVNAPMGFSPVIYGGGAASNQQVRTYYIPSTDSSAYYIGDVVKTIAGSDANGIPAVAKCASGNTPRGVVVGVVNPNPGNPSIQGVTLDLTITGIPATKSAAYYVLVNDDPRQVFEIQGDGTTFVTTDANKNASYTVAAPSLSSQLSATVLTAPATTSSLPLKILGFQQTVNNELGPYSSFIIQFNQHELAYGTAGV
jgi:hypothetical protein